MNALKFIITIMTTAIIVAGGGYYYFEYEADVEEKPTETTLEQYIETKDEFLNSSMRGDPADLGLGQISAIETECPEDADGPCGADILILSAEEFGPDVQEFYLAEEGGAGYSYYGPFTDDLSELIENATVTFQPEISQEEQDEVSEALKDFEEIYQASHPRVVYEAPGKFTEYEKDILHYKVIDPYAYYYAYTDDPVITISISKVGTNLPVYHIDAIHETSHAQFGHSPTKGATKRLEDYLPWFPECFDMSCPFIPEEFQKKYPELYARARGEKLPTEPQLQKAMAFKHDKPVSAVKITILEESDHHARGTVIFGPGGPGYEGMFLAVEIETIWTILHDGQDSVTCEFLAPYDFPEEMIEGHCY
ncbi:hypothetical protein HOE67_00550 [Candidatus Peregrinibacteria bacterium]|nr:hypothetical protein [Candidatus Peregrinibacteria bacterium]MBT4055579.1 hypothetical protein [Candidatus Peregrinibacteria bacterium]